MTQLHQLTRRGRLAAAALLTAAAAVTSAAAAAGPAQAVTRRAPFPAAFPSWQVLAQFHPGPATDITADENVIAVGSRDAWAFGGTNEDAQDSGTPIAQHWTGGQWQPVALPAGLTDGIGPASAPSASDIWAAGELGGYVLHWDGSAWSVAHQFTVDPSSGLVISDITATGPDDVWVFGTSGFGPGTGTWHFDGQAWTQATGIGDDVSRASALSAQDIWGIGRVGPSAAAAIMHWDGQAWSQVAAPLPAGARLSGIMAVSPASVWVSGISGADITSPPLLLHFDGQAWTQVPVPFPLDLGRLTPDGAGGLWISAEAVDPATLETHSVILQRSGAGTWTRHDFAATQSLRAVALIPGSRALWGAGFASTADGGNAVIFSFRDVRPVERLAR